MQCCCVDFCPFEKACGGTSQLLGLSSVSAHFSTQTKNAPRQKITIQGRVECSSIGANSLLTLFASFSPEPWQAWHSARSDPPSFSRATPNVEIIPNTPHCLFENGQGGRAAHTHTKKVTLVVVALYATVGSSCCPQPLSLRFKSEHPGRWYPLYVKDQDAFVYRRYLRSSEAQRAKR